MRIIALNSLKDSILWTYRSWCAGDPVSRDYKKWSLDPEGLDIYAERRTMRTWDFLRPFFASKGYTLYHIQPDHEQPEYERNLLPDPFGPKPHPSPSHPFSRYHCEDDERALFQMLTSAIYPARTSDGQEVVIKVVSGPNTTIELQALRALNSKEARRDSRNHTIYVLDFIEFDGLTFVVMPRWPNAFGPDFGYVKEYMHMTEVILEAYEFLHENRIAHCDFLEQNTGINTITGFGIEFAPGMRDSSVVRYALYDFNNSLMYPPGTILQDVRDTRQYNFRLHSIAQSEDPSVNPFNVDLAYVAGVLYRHLRVIEHVVPSLLPFLDKMKTLDPGYRLTAHDALAEFRQIYLLLTDDQLSTPVTNRWWFERQGKFITKEAYPFRDFYKDDDE